MVEIHETEIEILKDAAERADPVDLALESDHRLVEQIAALEDLGRQILALGGGRIVAEPLDLVRAGGDLAPERDQSLKDDVELRDERIDVIHRHASISNRVAVRCQSEASAGPPSRSGLRAASAVAALVFAAAGCSVPSVGLPSPTSPRTVGNLAVLERVTIDRFEDDQLRYRATARRVSLERTSGVATADEVAIDVMESKPAPPVSTRPIRDRRARARAAALSPKVKTRIEAETAISRIKEQIVTFTGQVTAYDRDGRTMTTGDATYDSAHDMLDAPGPVVLTGDNFRSEGASLHGKPIEGVLEVGPPVTTRVVPRGAH